MNEKIEGSLSQGSKRDKELLKKSKNSIISKKSLNSAELAITTKKNKQFSPTIEGINAMAVTPQEIRNTKVRWIIPGAIAFDTNVMLFAEAGTGKTLSTTYLCWWMLDNKAKTGVKHIIYFDCDNGMITLSDRRLDRLISRKPAFKYICFGQDKNQNFPIQKLLEFLKRFDFSKKNKTYFKNSVIVIDSIRDILEKDMTDDTYIKAVMQVLKNLRNKFGCCIIFLNHMPKGTSTYSGAASFKNSIDTAYFVERISDITERHDIVYKFTTEKARTGGNELNLSIKIDEKGGFAVFVSSDGLERKEENPAQSIP